MYKNNRFNNTKFIWLSFILSAIIMVIAYITLQIYPIGGKTVLRVDLYHQYGPFHEELRSRILNGQSLFYSWEGGLGKEFISQLAYYTASPLSFLMLLFPQKNMPEAMALFALIKISASAAFFAYYLKSTFKKNDLSIVAFSLMYAFTAFVVSYYWNIMWLDAVALFPLVALGIENLVKYNRHTLYGISLAITIIVNFYIAFIVCIFAVLYFLVILLSNYSLIRDKKTILNICLKFGLMSLIAGGISMFLTLPTAIALSHTSVSDSSFPKFKLYQNIYQLLTNHFLGARPVILARNEDLPNFYSGVITILLMPFYFFNRNIEKKEKILFGILLIFIYLCGSINIMDYLIHGMHYPANLPHRYTFIYSFIIIMLAYKAYINLKYVNFKLIYIFSSVYILVILTTEFVMSPKMKEVERVLTNSDIFLNLLVIAVYILILKYLQIYYEDKNKPFIITILTVCIFSEVTFNTCSAFNEFGVTSRDDYVRYIEPTQEILDYIDNNDKDFHRMEFRRFTAINDPSLHHYNGMSQFSSLAYGDTSKLIGNLGIAATGNSYRYYDPTPLIDAMFNIKYVMNKGSEISDTRYKYLTDNGSVFLYENTQVLPLGFMVNEDIKTWDTENKSPFQVQNEFAFLSTDIEDEIFTHIEIDDFYYEHIEITSDDKKGAYKYKLTDPEDLNKKPNVYTSILIDEEQHIFLYLDARNTKRVKMTEGEKDLSERELSAGKSLFDIGQVGKNGEKETIDVNFSLTNKGIYEKTYRKSGDIKIYAAKFNKQVFDKVYNSLSLNTLNIESFKDTKIIGSVNAEKSGVLFTSIPFDPGWEITVDGVKTNPIAIGNGGLIGLDLSKGSHEIIFKYTPKGFYVGCIVSIVSLAAFFFYNNYLKNKISKK